MGRPKKEIKKNASPISINLLKEIINILTETDKKLQLLPDCSKKDFLAQNKHLKKNYSKIKTISDNSIIIGNILRKSNSKNLSNDISDFQTYISSKSESFNKRYKHHISLTEEINTKINQLEVPFKKYIQNTATLKQLITKFKNNLGKSKNNNKSEDLNISAVESQITRMNTIFPLINESLRKLKVLSESLVNDLIEINKKNLDNFSNMLYKLSLINMEIIGMVDEKTSQVPGLNETAVQCFKCVDKIINNLQYQDIIKQKIDHIKHIHLKIISELKIAGNSSDYNIDLSDFKLASRIPDIAELQVAQLIYTNQEYKNVTENTNSKFIEITELMNSYADASNHFSKKYSRLDKDLLKDLHSNLNRITTVYEEFIKFKKNYAKDLKSVDKLSDDIYGYFTSLNSLNANIEQLTFNIIRKHFRSKDQKDIFSFAEQIEALLSDNNKDLHSIQFIYTGIQKNSKYLVLSIDNTRADVLILKNKREFLDSINNNFVAISKEYPLMMNALQKNILLSNSVSKEILPPQDHNTFYETFNKIIEEIIFNMNHIYKQICSENIDINQFKRDLTQKYKGNRNISSSERFIQSRTLNKLKGKNYLNNNLFIKNKKDHDIELF